MALGGLHFDRELLADICRRYRITRLEVFGSFARGEAGPASDLDLLVTFEEESELGLGFVALKQELERVFGRPVDLLTRSSVRRSHNKYFRRFALEHTERLYDSA